MAYGFFLAPICNAPLCRLSPTLMPMPFTPLAGIDGTGCLIANAGFGLTVVLLVKKSSSEDIDVAVRPDPPVLRSMGG
jgi:hypothetical protein